jgi:hypothetical protein
MTDALVPYQDLQSMAKNVVSSGLFPGIRSADQAVTLFMVAQAEGLHPIQAMRRYHIIQGQVSLRTDAMLADFMQRGGKINWIEVTHEACEAEFHSPGLVEPLKYRWTMEDAKRAGLSGKDNWRKDPRSMLKARVISGGLRLADPASVVGLYPPEEVQDFEGPKREPTEAEVVNSRLLGVDPEVAQAVAEAGKNRATQVAEYAPKAFDEKNAAELALGQWEAPPVCTLKGCDSIIGIFESTSKQFKGRKYFMCARAYDEKTAMLETGMTNAEANGAVSKHYRQWAEPWSKEGPPKDGQTATEGGA